MIGAPANEQAQGMFLAYLSPVTVWIWLLFSMSSVCGDISRKKYFMLACGNSIPVMKLNVRFAYCSSCQCKQWLSENKSVTTIRIKKKRKDWQPQFGLLVGPSPAVGLKFTRETLSADNSSPPLFRRRSRQVQPV